MPDALSPAQLDRIEDALEALERDGVDAVMGAGAPDPDVEQTLQAYASILELSREAFAPVEVPVGLLDGVLAEARAAAASTAPAESAPAAGWWQRVRWNLWGPGLAFAATAALLLVVVRPGADEPSLSATSNEAVAQRTPAEPADEAPPTVAPAPSEADGRLADATLRAEADGDLANAERGVGAFDARDGQDRRAADEAAVPVEEELAYGDAKLEEPPADPAATPTRDDTKARKSVTSSTASGSIGKSSGGLPGGSGAMGGKGGPVAPAPEKKAKAEPAPEPPPPPANQAPKPSAPAKPADKKDAYDDGWSFVTLGDQRREAGNCAGAKAAYQSGLEGDKRTLARSLAGLGLCALMAGNTSSAETYFAKARKADGSVGSFIQAERAAIEARDQAAADVDE